MRLVILAVDESDEGELDALRRRASHYAACDVSHEDLVRFVARVGPGASTPSGTCCSPGSGCPRSR